MSGPIPSYISLYKSGELKKRAERLNRILSSCTLCPRECGINRKKGETGKCRAGNRVRIAKAVPHFGEEPPISGNRGSGTIFFSFCNLSCCFCQNYQISRESLGQELSETALAREMIALQEKGCHNINLVSASHFLPQIIKALCIAAGAGLCLPIVYNTNGYENIKTLRLLSGIIDIYLPDAKYSKNNTAEKYSCVNNYPETNLLAINEMFGQTGHLKLDRNGVAVKGLIVRHLVLPENLSETEAILKNLKSSIGTDLSISLLSQFTPCYRAPEHKELGSPLSKKDYLKAVNLLFALGFENGWIQDWQPFDRRFLPDFEKQDSWN